ncbi:MAG: 2-C-methyl-D-erythritol 4-phosphate cytidylyltransferase [Firmicutes bacterium]|nr:2-C-methyl-D-erythritol 4-phosphate cytidylyltransferase [Bacillota bacterium]
MYQGKKVSVIIAAAGSGSRMGGGISKQYIEVRGIPVLARALGAFDRHPLVDEILVVMKREDLEVCRRDIVEKYGFRKVRKVIAGGKERQESVFIALSELSDEGYILVHDGARPFVSQDLITRIIEGAAEHGAAIPGVPLRETIKRAEDGWLAETLDRDTLFAVRTPQGFEAKMLKKAHDQAREEGFTGTDDGALLERIGGRSRLILCEQDNIKITTAEDLPLAGSIADRLDGPALEKPPSPPWRVGTGFDAHRLVPDRKLILGGVEIPYELGLLGHSDADVLLHAVMDALLGACALGDIGKHFPDKDPKYAGISSLLLLGYTREIMEEHGFFPGNVDVTLIGQKPKIAPYAPEMKKNIAKVLQIDENLVNVKATTTEKMGFCGREEGLAAEAAVTVWCK